MKNFLAGWLIGGMFLLIGNSIARAEVGKLIIKCIPEAYIFIDGQAAHLATTKKLKINIDVGKHVIIAETSGYLQETANIEIFAGAVAEVNLSLVRADQDRSRMVSIPADEYSMGIDQKRIKWILKNIGGSEKDYLASVPKHTVKLKAFRIDKYEVTNSRYKKFIKAAHHPAPRHWRGGAYRRNQDDYPVVNVSWSDAAAYCKWAKKRLPTEAEWEIAASGGKKSFYFPWGRKFRGAWTNTKGERFNAPTITGRYEKGISKFDCYDMAGNVWEWTADKYKPYPGSALSVEAADQNLRVARGGSFKSKPFMATTIYRKKLKADGIYDDVGFRCAR